MAALEVRAFELADRALVISVWQRCGLVVPWNDPERDIARKMRHGREFFLVGFHEQDLVATVMGGYEGHRGWINYLAVDPDYQRRGYAEKIIKELELLLVAAGCPKVNLQVRATNSAVVAFYEKIGYIQDANISFGKRLIADQID